MEKYTYPPKNELENFVASRYRTAWIWQIIFLSALLIAILAFPPCF